MAHFCKNHPDRKATRRCYYCQSYVCSDCQILASKHYFCSFRCYNLYRGEDTSYSLKEKLIVMLDNVTEALSSFRDILAKNWQTVAIFLLMIALTFSLRKLQNISHELESLEQNTSMNHFTSSHLLLQPSEENFRIQKPVNGGMVLTNKIDIEGEAQDNQIISLVADGEIIAVTLPKNGKFVLKDITAKRGKNQFIVKAIDADGRVTTLQSINFFYSSPTLRYLAHNVTRGDLSSRRIAITFDGGSLANVTEEILDILKEKNLHCTFFLTGTFITKFPELVQRIVEEGHEVGNHTWSHPHLTTFAENHKQLTRPEVTREFLQNQLRRTAKAFKKLTGQEMAPFWRAPYGEHNLQIRQWAAELGYRHVEWTMGKDWYNTMDTLDWVADTTSPAYRTADEIVDKILNFGNGSDYGANGCIILMHLGSLRNSDFPHKRLPEIIDGLRERGYELVKVSELLADLN